MQLPQLLSILALVLYASCAPADSQVTQAPDFIGWVRQGAGYEVAICEKGIFSSSRYWAACIDTDQPALPTRCRDGSVLVLPSTTVICPTTATCRTDWFFEDPADTAARTMIGCVTGTRTLYHYRATAVPAGSTTAAESSSTTTTTTSSISTQPSMPTEASTPNLAWIAGPIVGGFVGIALIILLVWFLMRRRDVTQASRASITTETPESEPRGEKVPVNVVTSTQAPLGRNPTRRAAELPVRPSSL